MPDSDDMLVKNSLGILLEKALESKADLVVADFLELTDEEIERFDNFAQKYLKVKVKKIRMMKMILRIYSLMAKKRKKLKMIRMGKLRKKMKMMMTMMKSLMYN